MSIHPLPVFEADADSHHRSARTDEEIYADLKPPTSIVVRFGAMKLVGEFPYSGDAKPGCGSKLVIRTHRGTEIGEMLTSTCPNAGCSKSVTRQEMLDYIENSGGRDYPFHTNGRILRIATIDDLNEQAALEQARQHAVRISKQKIRDHGLEQMKLVEAEPILGGELLTFYYMSEDRVDFRELVRDLASEFKTRIEMRQVGARDEARLVADYERCGQHCCCKQFLKVLKPVSMGAAKRQKATLEPLKISGRCGRLMCCLRYEDQTYKELKARLPRKRTRVGTAEGPGIVLDTKLLVQLVLVELEHDQREIAVPVEELMDPEMCPPPGSVAAPEESDPLRGMDAEEVEKRSNERTRKRRGRKSKAEQQDAHRARAQGPAAADDGGGGGDLDDNGDGGGDGDGDRDVAVAVNRAGDDGGEGDSAARSRKRRRRRRKRKGGDDGVGSDGGDGSSKDAAPLGAQAARGIDGDSDGGGDGGSQKKRRRRRRRRKGGGGSSGDAGTANKPSEDG